MIKSLAFLMSLFPVLVMADGSSLSFTPPTSDYSVVFLADIFGVVDGVLHGTGSQIMGNVFSVFNAAVLALGGIVIMYTLLVSTMNTAHEGQMLGQKWSSIWIPVRSTVGLTLLIPKASGYCLMQIFVMWVVVQGVGAADKVWNVALSYLNAGGVIIQKQQDPTYILLHGGLGDLPKGAQTMLSGQVCMLGLETLLRNKLQSDQVMKEAGGGDCFNISPDAPLAPFCKLSNVPSFMSTVSIVSEQVKQSGGSTPPPTFHVDMPNFDKGSLFAPINGLCGTLSWDSISSDPVMQSILSPSELATMLMSRAIALQQMYMDLASVTQTAINNDPDFLNANSSSTSPITPSYSAVAVQPFGLPQTATGTACPEMYATDCILWASLGGSGAALYSGTEFRGAMQDYNAVMMPFLNLTKKGNQQSTMVQERAFIATSEQQGWITAGAYFFDLVTLNTAGASTSSAGDSVDLITGLGGSAFNPGNLVFEGKSCDSSKNTYIPCIILGNDSLKIQGIERLIDGLQVLNPKIPTPVLDGSTKVIPGLGSSTIYGYTNNSMLLTLPGQPGFSGPTFKIPKFSWMSLTPSQIPFSPQLCVYDSSQCGWSTPDIICEFMQCIPTWIEEDVKQGVISILNFLITQVYPLIQTLMDKVLIMPLQVIMQLFQFAVSVITQPGANPIVALAQMGTFFINFAASMWVAAIPAVLIVAVIPVIGVVAGPILMFLLPLLTVWLSIMMSVGFILAYYVPLLPYMLFTFGAIAWLMTVIEAMVAGPIVALGITHPEGHETLGKGEHAVMILMNVFLRPTLMIIGFIASISLSYVGVWVLNSGFSTAIAFINTGTIPLVPYNLWSIQTDTGGYVSWAGIYGYFFCILIYTWTYWTIVEKAFTLIAVLPDKVLRWVGGQHEGAGQESAQWAQGVQSKVSEGGKEAAGTIGQTNKQATAGIMKGGAKATKATEKGDGPEVKGG
ncbi:MAG: type IVB secretion system protein DotA [Legionellales bacterium]|nr:type IVB secretion system protein DotA [Legionellales bacterium]